MIYRLLYEIAIRIYGSLILLASIRSEKAKNWVSGRRNWSHRLRTLRPRGELLWIHASSLGEFEMAKPILAALKQSGSRLKVVVSFFSPSGLKHFESDGLTDASFYLPLDTAANAKKLIEILNPTAVLYIKYEFWPNILQAVIDRKIPLFFAGVVFRRDQWFWTFLFNPVKPILHQCTKIMVQNHQSYQIAAINGLAHNTVLTGDMRFDRAWDIRSTPYENEFIKKFTHDRFTIIAGSSWQADEEKYFPLIEKYKQWRWIIVPHDISMENIKRIVKNLPCAPVLFTEMKNDVSDSNVLLVNTIGHLAKLYRFGKVALIGGGFGSGLHNTLEALAYGIPVCFGPKHKKFWEASELLENGLAYCYRTTENLENYLLRLQSPIDAQILSEKIIKWFYQYRNAGSKVAEILLQYLNRTTTQGA
ncbi:3-deoxy-D-manno-octulosonic acid transferase [Schleiferia thermophila]|jgi:3-deoxy-D-manno-octulosonic-acid transferase|uniref:3-deoxy-D-manno-octulosonic acid transferase n=1 Tax=Schleiferia thermophila TaxID=884107 RepID=UPI0004E74DB6|nr:glycosyltransferase N-terminal domain-containing protein [Schleiferia thermophila]KFD38202.1 hypothetical protein AT05_11270 [Schleiferia thermophila str. Yellowstone]